MRLIHLSLNLTKGHIRDLVTESPSLVKFHALVVAKHSLHIDVHLLRKILRRSEWLNIDWLYLFILDHFFKLEDCENFFHALEAAVQKLVSLSEMSKGALVLGDEADIHLISLTHRVDQWAHVIAVDWKERLRIKFTLFNWLWPAQVTNAQRAWTFHVQFTSIWFHWHCLDWLNFESSWNFERYLVIKLQVQILMVLGESTFSSNFCEADINS